MRSSLNVQLQQLSQAEVYSVVDLLLCLGSSDSDKCVTVGMRSQKVDPFHLDVVF